MCTDYLLKLNVSILLLATGWNKKKYVKFQVMPPKIAYKIAMIKVYLPCNSTENMNH